MVLCTYDMKLGHKCFVNEQNNPDSCTTTLSPCIFTLGPNSSDRRVVFPQVRESHNGGELNLAVVPQYAQYLRSKNVDAVLVNGTVGEGGLMTNGERIKLTEAWIDATKGTNQSVMVHVGGTNLNNVIALAKHAEAVGAWSILCLPELYYRPKTIDELIDYLKIVGAAAPNTPLFYYHYPQLTGVTLDMAKFLDKAYSEIPTISGLKYTHNNLDEGTRCVQLRDRTFAIFLGSDQLLSAALCMGFDSMILTILNFAAQEAHDIKDSVLSGDIQRRRKFKIE